MGLAKMSRVSSEQAASLLRGLSTDFYNGLNGKSPLRRDFFRLILA
jgi:hypothetical protein